MREKIPLIFALLFAVAALFGIYQYLQSQKVVVSNRPIVAAKTDIVAGRKIERGDLQAIEIPKDQFVQGMYPGDEAGLQMLVNLEAATDIMKGKAIFDSQIKIQGLKVPDITQKIDLEFRAISIPVDQTGSVSQLVKPGDRVDVLVNYEIPYIRETEVEVPNTGKFKVGQKETEPATIFLLQNVRVLAVDRAVEQDEGYSDPGDRGYRAVTIQVSPAEARMLAFANKNAKDGYTLILRNPRDTGVLEDYEVASYKTVLEMASLKELLEIRRDQQARIIEGGVDKNN